MKKCSICGKAFEGFGNNPSPFSGGVCCDECGNGVVTHLRLFLSGARRDQILVIHPSGVMTIVDEDTDEVPLEELQSLVGGYIEVHPSRNEHFVYIVNEEGLLMGLEPNGTAKEILGIEAVGPVVVVPKGLFK